MFVLQSADFQRLLRRERDSNPRYSCPYTAFRVRPDRPLRHLSFLIVKRSVFLVLPCLLPSAFRPLLLALCPMEPLSCLHNSAPPLHFTPKLSFCDCKYRHIFYFFAVPGKKNVPEPKFIPENTPKASFYSEKDYLCRHP